MRTLDKFKAHRGALDNPQSFVQMDSGSIRDYNAEQDAEFEEYGSCAPLWTPVSNIANFGRYGMPIARLVAWLLNLGQKGMRDGR